jgi:hypothetical protein
MEQSLFTVLERAKHAADCAGYPYVVWSPIPGKYVFAPALTADMSGDSRRIKEFDGKIVEPSEE